MEEKKPDLAYRLFKELAAEGLPGLVITRQYPDRVRKETGLGQSEVLWLATGIGENRHDPTAIGTLAKTVSRFIEDHGGEAAILLDGLEYLTVKNGFLQTLMFVEHVNEFVMQRKAVVIIPVAREALEEKELALLERNLRVLPAPEGRSMRGPTIRVRFIPRTVELAVECDRIRRHSFDFVPADVDVTSRSFEERIREARKERIPFVVLVRGGEEQSGIVNVILRTGAETWMSLESLIGAVKDSLPPSSS